MTASLLWPDPDSLGRLTKDLSTFFAQFAFVQRVKTFGSLASRRCDRWSDIDLIVVVSSQTCYRTLFHSLCAHKPVLHHGVFTPWVEPAGGCVLGMVFEAESVFHCLDLNFMTLAECQMPHALERFGPTHDLYVSSRTGLVETVDTAAAGHQRVRQHPDEARIYDAIHWTKKSAKKVLRGQKPVDELRIHAEHLRTVMEDYPDNPLFPGGDICGLAHTYLRIADQLLA